MKLQYNKQYSLTLSKPLIEALGWKKGDIILVKVGQDQTLVLSKKK